MDQIESKEKIKFADSQAFALLKSDLPSKGLGPLN